MATAVLLSGPKGGGSSWCFCGSQEYFYLITFCAEPSPFDRVRGHGREGEPTCGGIHVGIGTWSGSCGTASCAAARVL